MFLQIFLFRLEGIVNSFMQIWMSGDVIELESNRISYDKGYFIRMISYDEYAKTRIGAGVGIR